MRILAIRGKNLASLEGGFAVELDQPPLDRAGLFAITGPTGAGKSTLLDAICLALFDQMPRLPKGQGVAIGRADESDERRIKSNDVCSILRRGSSEGYAEVDFIGNDRRCYRARWELRRARGRAEGKLKPQEVSLRDLSAGQLLGRTKTEVLTLISERLGLNFDQFRRSVLLPQGDFAVFLKTDGKSRSELLERITGTEIYGELSKAAHRRAAEEKKGLEDLEKQLGASRPLDDPVRQDLERQQVEQQRNHQQAERIQQAAQQVIDWRKRLAELEDQERAAFADLSKFHQALQEAAPRRQEWQAVQQAQALRSLVDNCERTAGEYERVRQTLEQARAAEAEARKGLESARHGQNISQAALSQASADWEVARGLLQQARILDQQLADAGSRCDKSQRESDQADSQARQIEQRWHALRADQAELEDRRDRAAAWLAQNNHTAELARQWERWDGELKQYTKAQSEARRAAAVLKDLEVRVAEQEIELASLSERIVMAQSASEAAQAALRACEAELQAYSPQGLRAERFEFQQRSEQLRALHGLVQAAIAKVRELAQSEAALRQAQALATRAGQMAGLKAEELERQRTALDEADRALQFALIAHKEDVQSLRVQLRDGEPCPVCGATRHPWAQEGASLKRLLQEQQQRVEALKARLHELVEDRSRLDSDSRHAGERAAELATQLIVLQSEAAALQEQWAERPAQEMLPDDLFAQNLAEDLFQRLQAAAADLARVERAEQNALEAQSRFNATRSESDRCRGHSDRLQRAFYEIQQTLGRLNAEQEARKAVQAHAEQTLRQSRMQLAGPLAGILNWQQALDEDPEALRRRCQEAVLHWRQNLEDWESLAGRLQELVPLFKEAEVEARKARELAGAQAAEFQKQQQNLQDLQRRRSAFFAGQSADSIETRLIEAERTAKANQQQAGRALETAQSAYIAACTDLARCNSELGRQQAARDSTGGRLQNSLAEHGIDLQTLRRRLQYDTAWLEAERAELEELRTHYERAQALLQERRANRERHQADNPPLQSTEEAQQQLAQAEGDRQTAYARLLEIGGRLKQDDDSRALALRLQKDYEHQRQRWELWESLRGLIGSHDGSVFRSYAQSLTLDILLAHANRHLEDLARRYRLERVPGSDLDLQVIDRDMGDEVRSVHSLSGGESFLVSLGLALGLASLSSRRTQVESLFIDEGFGSLDPDTLDVAIASLDALQAQGRKVGVISHVPAMVERIGVQVRVEARGGGRSVIKVMDAAQSWSDSIGSGF